MIIGGDLYSRVCQWLLDVVVAHLYVGVSSISWMPRCLTASWMCLLPNSIQFNSIQFNLIQFNSKSLFYIAQIHKLK